MGLKGTSHFIRGVTCNMLEMDYLPAGSHDIVLYSGDPRVIKTLQEADMDLDDYVTVTHVQLPKNDTLDQQWMTFAPPTLQSMK